MAAKKRKTTTEKKAQRRKTEFLSMRVDPKTRFALEFVSRVMGQKISTVVERAVEDVADGTVAKDGAGKQRTWREYWSQSEGVRTINLLLEPVFRTTDEEDRLRDFLCAHWELFFATEPVAGAPTPHVHESVVEILWPRIDEFVELWEREKATDTLAAENEMRAKLGKRPKTKVDSQRTIDEIMVRYSWDDLMKIMPALSQKLSFPDDEDPSSEQPCPDDPDTKE